MNSWVPSECGITKTSESILATRLSAIDELTRPDHTFLTAEDNCFYLGEYSARAGFSFSTTNDLIQNLKKPMDRKDRPEWKWKQKAIDRWAEMLRQVLTDGWLKDVTLVPVPPSKTKDHPEYDDRLLQILQKLGAGQNLDIRELVVMKESIDPAHLREDRRSVRELIEKMDLDDELMKPPPSAIFIFDDVLTTGAHFKAVESVLRSKFPDVFVAGLFLARRVPESLPI